MIDFLINWLISTSIVGILVLTCKCMNRKNATLLFVFLGIYIGMTTNPEDAIILYSIGRFWYVFIFCITNVICINLIYFALNRYKQFNNNQ